jgi:hypothetical protein
MSRIDKTTINPKTAFFILVTMFLILAAFSIPLFSQIISDGAIDISNLFTSYFFAWGFFGLIAGIGVALFGIISLSGTILVKLIRFLLILFIVLVFITYIVFKTFS